MSALSLTVAYGPGEAPQSFLCRTAARNGVDVASFCRHMGLDLVRVANGFGPDVDRLAHLTGADLGSLRRNALVKCSDRTWTIDGQTAEWHMVRRRDLRVCPVCLAGDAAAHAGPQWHAAYCRTSWLIDQIRTCPLHAVALVGLQAVDTGETGERKAVHDFTARLRSTCGGAGVRGLPIRRTYVSGLEAYLAGRLTGERSHAWVDDLPFNVAAMFTERLGAAILHGPATRFDDLDADGWKAAADVGWEVMSRGERGLSDFASALGGWVTHGHDAGAGFEDSFGKFWPFVLRVSRRPGYATPCKALISTIAGSRPAVPERLVPEGQRARSPGYRLSAAAVDYGRTPGTLRRVLSRHGVLEPGQGHVPARRLLLDRDRVAAAMDEFGRRMSLVRAGRHIGATPGQVGLLYAAGLLGDGAPRRRRGVNVTVGRADLDALMLAMARGAVERSEPDVGEGTLLQAARSARRTLAEVARLVVDGKLGWLGRHSGVTGLASVLVRTDEVRTILAGGVVPGHTAIEVARLLRVGYPGVKALIADGHLSTVVVRQRRSGQPYDVVTPASLDGFRRRYVSVSAVAIERGLHPHAMRARLTGRGVEPTLPTARYGTSIYLRTDIPGTA